MTPYRILIQYIIEPFDPHLPYRSHQSHQPYSSESNKEFRDLELHPLYKRQRIFSCSNQIIQIISFLATLAPLAFLVTPALAGGKNLVDQPKLTRQPKELQLNTNDSEDSLVAGRAWTGTVQNNVTFLIFDKHKDVNLNQDSSLGPIVLSQVVTMRSGSWYKLRVGARSIYGTTLSIKVKSTGTETLRYDGEWTLVGIMVHELLLDACKVTIGDLLLLYRGSSRGLIRRWFCHGIINRGSSPIERRRGEILLAQVQLLV
jgi:hypothetical protein